MTESSFKVSLRRLYRIDFLTVSNFIDTEVKTIPKDFFFPPSKSIIDKSLDPILGISHGAFDGDKLIGVRLTYKPGLDNENHGYDLGYSDKKLIQVAQFHGTLVLNERRYKGIGSQLVQANCNDIFNNSLSYILATVHPANYASINMLLHNGFERKLQVIKYQNLPRLIFEKQK